MKKADPTNQDFDPLRPPTWRYELAQQRLHAGANYYRPVDDPGMIRAYQYQIRRRGISNQYDAAVAELVCRRSWPVVHRAFSLSEDAKIRPIVEARILAGQSDHEISDVSGIPAESIGQFAEIFFDVRDRLEYPDYIQTHVIGHYVGSGDMNDSAMALRHMAYHHGHSAVDMLISGRSAKTPGMALNEVIDMRIRETANLQALMATSAHRPGRFDVRMLLEASSRNYEQDLRSRGANEQSQWVTDFMKSLIKSCPMPRGTQDETTENPGLKNYMAGCVELRAAEQLRASSEGGLPYLHQLENFVPPFKRTVSEPVE